MQKEVQNKYKPVRVSMREWDYVRYLLDPGSNTFTNCYQSALQAGYTEHVARMITWRVGRERISEILHMMQDPINKQLIEDLSKTGLPYASEHLRKDIAARQNRKWEALSRELAGLSGGL